MEAAAAAGGVSGGVGGGGEDLSATPAAVVSRWGFVVSQRFQHLLDKSTPHIAHRWIGFAAVAAAYALRVYFVQGFYIVSYGLGIYILNLLIAFLSPQVDPEIQELTDGPTLPLVGRMSFARLFAAFRSSSSGTQLQKPSA